MATDLQEDLADAIVKNKSLPRHKRKNKAQLLVSVGYAQSTAEKQPSVILEAKGVQDSLAKKGLTKELITESLVFDIENKPKRRERELRLGAEILGILNEEKPPTSITNNIVQIVIHSSKDANSTGHIPNA